MSDDALRQASPRPGVNRAAWRRWEMHEVGAEPLRPAQESQPTLHSPPPPDPDPPGQDIDQLVEQVLTQARQQGHAEGYKAGLAEGRQAGQAQGHAEGLQAGRQQAKDEQGARLAHLDTMLSDADHALAQLDGQVAQGIVDLALRIARQVIQGTLTTRPEALLDTVRDLLQPQEGQLSWLRVHVHPDDQPLLTEYLQSLPAPPPWQVQVDADIAPGGCRLETSLGQIDATLPTRWQRVIQSLGASSPPWQEPV